MKLLGLLLLKENLFIFTTQPAVDITNTPQTSQSQQAKYSVTDLSGQLNDKEKEVLSLGPKFIIKEKPKLIQMLTSIHRLRYNMEWRQQMASAQQPNFFRYPHDREFCKPPESNDADYVYKIRTMVQKLTQVAKKACSERTEYNLTMDEKKTLTSLKDKELVLLPSDKGGEFCCLTTDQTAPLHNLISVVTFTNASETARWRRWSVKSTRHGARCAE